MVSDKLLHSWKLFENPDFVPPSNNVFIFNFIKESFWFKEYHCFLGHTIHACRIKWTVNWKILQTQLGCKFKNRFCNVRIPNVCFGHDTLEHLDSVILRKCIVFLSGPLFARSYELKPYDSANKTLFEGGRLFILVSFFLLQKQSCKRMNHYSVYLESTASISEINTKPYVAEVSFPTLYLWSFRWTTNDSFRFCSTVETDCDRCCNQVVTKKFQLSFTHWGPQQNLVHWCALSFNWAAWSM